MDDPLASQPLCSVCGTSEFQLIRTETLVTTVFVDTAIDAVSEPIPSDEPAHAEEAWTCENGHLPTWEQQEALYQRVTAG